MAITSAQYTVGTSTPVQIYLGDGASTVHLHTASGTLYLGDANVTTSTGYIVDSGDKLVFETHESSIYAITNTGTTTVSVMVLSR
jgi:hypothetical protein